FTIDTIANSGAKRSNGVVTIQTTAAHNFTVGQLVNIAVTSDSSFNGTFTVATVPDSTHFTYSQFGQNIGTGIAGGGTADSNITKSVGRSYAWAWENTKTINGSNFSHVGAPSPSTQFIAYSAQNGQIQLIEPGTVTTNGTTAVVGVGTAF